MRVGLSSKRRFGKIFFIAVAVFMFLIAIKMFERLEINFLSAAEEYVNIQTAKIIDKTVEEFFADTESDILQSFDDKSIITDTMKINSLRSKITTKIQNSLDRELEGLVYVPLGAVLESTLFHSVGPDIPVKIRPIGYVISDIKNEFNSEGINQVRHSMTLFISVEVRYTGLFLHHDTMVESEIPIIENISIGDVPDYYGDMGILD